MWEPILRLLDNDAVKGMTSTEGRAEVIEAGGDTVAAKFPAL